MFDNFAVLMVTFGLLIASLWLLWKAVLAHRRKISLLKNLVETKGVVFRLDDITSDGDPVISYMPFVRYRGDDGVKYEAMLSVTHDYDSHRVGKKVKIFFQRGNPSNMSDRPNGWGAEVALAVSTLFAIFAILVFGACARSCLLDQGSFLGIH